MATIEKVKAKYQVVGNVIVHEQTIFTVNSNSAWIEGTDLIRLSIRRAGSYDVKTIEVDCDLTFETLVV